jgi:hypothetical protein
LPPRSGKKKVKWFVQRLGAVVVAEQEEESALCRKIMNLLLSQWNQNMGPKSALSAEILFWWIWKDYG